LNGKTGNNGREKQRANERINNFRDARGAAPSSRPQNMRAGSSRSSKTPVRRHRPVHNGMRSDDSSMLGKLKGYFTPKVTLYCVIGAIALLLLICMLVSFIIGVQSIEVNGCDMATPDEIISASGIAEGSGYFSYNTGKVEKNILDSLPCLTEADIDRSIFGKVVITVSEKKAYWYTEIFGEYYVLSESLEVIRRTDNKSELIDRGLVRLDFPEVKSAVLGKVIEFTDGDRDCSFIGDFLADIRESELYKSGRMDQIGIETKFEIFVVCDLKYKINIGKYSSADVKLDMVAKALDDEQFSGDSLWQIDVSNVSRIVTRQDYELDLSYLKP
jgi:hypothetical protein